MKQTKKTSEKPVNVQNSIGKAKYNLTTLEDYTKNRMNKDKAFRNALIKEIKEENYNDTMLKNIEKDFGIKL